MNYRCPVCFFAQMPYPPEDYDICPCCGTEFGNDDAEYSYDELRYRWLIGGALWFYGQPPLGWSAARQLADAAFGLHTEVSTTGLNNLSIHEPSELEFQFA